MDHEEYTLLKSHLIKLPPPCVELKAAKSAPHPKENELITVLMYKNTYFIADGIKRLFLSSKGKSKGHLPAHIIRCSSNKEKDFYALYIRKRMELNSFRKMSVIESCIYSSLEKKYRFKALRRALSDTAIIKKCMQLAKTERIFLSTAVESIKQLKHIKDIPPPLLSLLLRTIRRFPCTQSELIHMLILFERAYFSNRKNTKTALSSAVKKIKNKEGLKVLLFSIAYPRYSEQMKRYRSLLRSINAPRIGRNASIRITEDPLLEREHVELRCMVNNGKDVDEMIAFFESRKKEFGALFDLLYKW
ncbi:hypothetical protein ACFL6D_01205 [Spirochaetota bacterium]